jgi:hypothetical protein
MSFHSKYWAVKRLTPLPGNTHFVKVDTKGPMTISMLLGLLMSYSLIPVPSTSFIDLLFKDKLSILYEGLLHPVDFPILIELNGGSDIGVLLFGLIGRIIRF